MNTSIDNVENYIPDSDQKAVFKSKNFKGKIMIVAEGWCIDSCQSVSIIHKFFGEEHPVKIIYRDQNKEWLAQFVTDESQSVPIVFIIDNEFNLIAHWGPRPQNGQKLLKKFKSSSENFCQDTFLLDLNIYYDRNNGFDIIDEILQLI
ncbi:thioredoxin family protein [Sphingobacterium kitahiroshimense]|uniref:Thioredoxin family protein n=1 Tax=Sphingobacterium kitahiroshimense TaxID=470446 RepID=A0ABV0BZE8_9SPHI